MEKPKFLRKGYIHVKTQQENRYNVGRVCRALHAVNFCKVCRSKIPSFNQHFKQFATIIFSVYNFLQPLIYTLSDFVEII